MEPLVKFMVRKWLQSAVLKREAYEWFYALGYLEQVVSIWFTVHDAALKDGYD